MSRATRHSLAAVVLMAALATTSTAQEGSRGPIQRSHPSHQSSGLLGALFGRTAKPPQQSTRHIHTSRQPQSAHQTQPARHPRSQPSGHIQPVGLLDRLRSFTDSDGDEPMPAAATQATGPADWSGVPYHKPTGNPPSRTPQPIRDPSDRPVGSGTAAASGSHAARVPVQSGARRTGAGAIPTPPTDAQASRRGSPATADNDPQPIRRPVFSATQSSRRSGRRSIDPLETVAASPSDLTTTPQSPSAPRVAQRTVTADTGSTDDETTNGEAARRPGGGTPPSLSASAGAGASAAANASVASPTASADADAAVAASEQEPAQVAQGPAAADATAAADDGWKSGGDRADVTGIAPPAANSSTAAVGSGLADAGTAATGDGASLRPAAGSAAPAVAGQTEVAANLSADIHAVSSEVPGVRVVSQGPANLVIHQVTEYEIRVENRGATEAPGVFVRTVLPQWVEVRGHHASRGEVAAEQNKHERQLLWQVDRLAAGATERLTLRLAAGQSGTFDVALDWTLLPQTNVAHVRVQEPKLQLLIEGPEEVVYGESATYKVRVLNPGDGPAPNVAFTLSPNSATPQTQQIGTIPAGKEAQFEVELAAQDLGDLQIHGLATGDLSLRTEATRSIRVAAAKLEAVLSGPQLKYQDSEASYQLNVVNSGAAASHDITATLRLPAGVRYLGGLDGAEADGDTLRWQIDQLAQGASRDYAFRCQMSSTGSHLLAFDCAGTAGGKTAVSIATRVEALADLVLTVADPPAPAPVGAEVVYEVTIRNRGSKAASDVQAVTHFSDGIEPVRVEGHSGEISLGQVQFAAIPRIEAGQEVRLRVVAKAAAAGLHRFRTEVTSGDTVLVAEEATRYLSATTERVSRRSSDDVQR